MKQLTFKKEILPLHTVEGYGPLKKCRRYQVYEEERLAGEFLINDDVCLFSYGDNNFRVDVENYLVKNSSYSIIDQRTQQQAGEYKIPSWTGVNGSKLLLGLREYRSSIRNWQFAFTRGRYTISIGNEVEEVTYHLEIPWKLWSSCEMRPSEGMIELKGDNLALLFAGIYLVENALAVQSAVATGI